MCPEHLSPHHGCAICRLDMAKSYPLTRHDALGKCNNSSHGLLQSAYDDYMSLARWVMKHFPDAFEEGARQKHPTSATIIHLLESLEAYKKQGVHLAESPTYY